MGHLELTVMEMLWERGKGNVHDVVRWLNRPLAYNTVMTTLDRLFKRLTNRSKQERAYYYAPLLSRREWQQKQAEDLVARFLSGSARGRHPRFVWWMSSANTIRRCLHRGKDPDQAPGASQVAAAVILPYLSRLCALDSRRSFLSIWSQHCLSYFSTPICN